MGVTTKGCQVCALGQVLGVEGGKVTELGLAFSGRTFQLGTQMQQKCHEGPDGEGKMLLSERLPQARAGQHFLEAVTLRLSPQA